MRFRSSSGKADWAEHVQRAVKAFNVVDLEYLMDSAPMDVKDGSQLEFFLQRKDYLWSTVCVSWPAARTA